MRKIVPILIVLLAVVHQDFWNWEKVDPLVFGFIPIGLAWHVGISVMAAVVVALLCRYCWPENVAGADGDEKRRFLQ